MTHPRFHLIQFIVALIFGMLASESSSPPPPLPPPFQAWQTTEKAGLDRVKHFADDRQVPFDVRSLKTDKKPHHYDDIAKQRRLCSLRQMLSTGNDSCFYFLEWIKQTNNELHPILMLKCLQVKCTIKDSHLFF